MKKVSSVESGQQSVISKSTTKLSMCMSVSIHV